MMRFVLFALALAACTTTPIDPMGVYFANTVLVTQPYGETDRILLNADHTYTMYGVRFPEGHGRWDLENNQVCLMPGDTPENRRSKILQRVERWSCRRSLDDDRRRPIHSDADRNRPPRSDRASVDARRKKQSHKAGNGVVAPRRTE